MTRWINPDKALIQLSLRGKYEDLFWFTFFHEAGHILLHGKKDIFIESKKNESNKELEADIFAKDLLIPIEKWQDFIKKGKFKIKREVVRFASELNISPAIVVGRLQHDGLIQFSHLNELKRKYEFVKK
jgi:Zn-dependent peptidase ImmA (M78 family)